MIFPSPSCITTEKFSKSFICVCFQLRFETICRESDLGKIFLFILFNIKKILSFNYSINCILISISAYRMLILQLMLQKPNLKKNRVLPPYLTRSYPTFILLSWYSSKSFTLPCRWQIVSLFKILPYRWNRENVSLFDQYFYGICIGQLHFIVFPDTNPPGKEQLCYLHWREPLLFPSRSKE